MKTILYLILIQLILVGWESRTRASETAELKYANGSLLFMQNKGQADPTIEYYANTFFGGVQVTYQGDVEYHFINKSNPFDRKGVGCNESFPLKEANCSIHGLNPSSASIHYFNGSQVENWNSKVPVFHYVLIEEIAPGIDLKLQAHANNVEKIFVIQPFSRIPDNLVKFNGIESLFITKKGQLAVVILNDTTCFSKPIAFQEIDGQVKDIDVCYSVNQDDHSYSFEVSEYNKAFPLNIDPLLASTYFGGSGDEINYGPFIEIDDQDYVYLSGFTNSISNFPVTSGAYQQSYAGGTLDCFVAKFNNNLDSLIACTFIGGSGFETECTLTLDNNGYVYIGGYTNSTDFPVTTGAFSTENSGEYDIFIAKLTDDLSSLVASTYIGGSSNDGYQENRIDLQIGNNNILYVAAQSQSSDFPVTLGAYDPTFNGVSFLYSGDAVVFKMNAELTELIASTYLGGSLDEYRVSLTLDPEENVFVSCGTYSWNMSMPSGSFDPYYNDSLEIVIFKLSNDLSELLAGTYLGASGNELAFSLNANSLGDIYISGYTSSVDFPVSPNAFCQLHSGMNDAFISKFNNDLSELLCSTFLGGAQPDVGQALALDPPGDVYITGKTLSTDFPIISGTYDDTYNGGGPEHGDIFVSRLNSDLSQLKASTYLGGSADEKPFGIALDSNKDVFVAGLTHSNNCPVTPNCFDPSFNGGFRDVILTKLDLDISTNYGAANGQSDPATNLTGFPNPFTDEITFKLPKQSGGRVNMVVLDHAGNVVYENNHLSTSDHHILSWNGRDQNGYDLPNGIYIYIISASNYTFHGKIIKINQSL